MGAILAEGNSFPNRSPPSSRRNAPARISTSRSPNCAPRNSCSGPAVSVSYGPMKYALSMMMGTRQTYQRPPHPDVTEEQKTKIKEALEQLKQTT